MNFNTSGSAREIASAVSDSDLGAGDAAPAGGLSTAGAASLRSAVSGVDVFRVPAADVRGQERRGVSNTPAQRQDGAQGVTGFPDWLEGRFPLRVGGDGEPESLSVESVLDMFGRRSDGEQLPWVQEEHSRGGYPVYVRGHVSVHDVPSKGVYLQITGQGCRELEGDGVVHDWQGLGLNLWAVGFEANRFDFAFDDHDGILPFEEIKAITEHAAKTMLEEKSFVTRAKRVGGEWSGGVGRPYGYTLGYGVRGSETYVRIYDKAAQLRSLGQEVEGECTRVEMEWRRERAQAALLAFAGYRMPTVREFSEGISDIVPLDVAGSRALAGLLRSHIEFKDAAAVGRFGESFSRVKNAPAAPWWDKFLGLAEKASLVLKPVIRSVDKSVQWVAKQVAPALGLILRADGFGLRSLYELAKLGTIRFRKSHEEMLATHNFNFARSQPLPDGSDVQPMMRPELVPGVGQVENRMGPEEHREDVWYYSEVLRRHYRPGEVVPV